MAGRRRHFFMAILVTVVVLGGLWKTSHLIKENLYKVHRTPVLTAAKIDGRQGQKEDSTDGIQWDEEESPDDIEEHTLPASVFSSAPPDAVLRRQAEKWMSRTNDMSQLEEDDCSSSSSCCDELLETKAKILGKASQRGFKMADAIEELQNQRKMMDMTVPPFPSDTAIDPVKCPPRSCPENIPAPACKKPSPMLMMQERWVCIGGQVSFEDTTCRKLDGLKTDKQQALVYKADASRWARADVLYRSNWEVSYNKQKDRGEELASCPRTPSCLDPPPPSQPLCELTVNERSAERVTGVVCDPGVGSMVLQVLIDDAMVPEDVSLPSGSAAAATTLNDADSEGSKLCRPFEVLLPEPMVTIGYHTVDLFCKRQDTGMREMAGSVNVLKGQTVAKNSLASELDLFQTLQDPRRNRQGLVMGLAEILRLRLPDIYTQMEVPAEVARVEGAGSSPSPSRDEDWEELAKRLYGVLEEHLPPLYRDASDRHDFLSSSGQLQERLDRAQAGLVAGEGGREGECEKNVAICAIVKDAARTTQEWVTFHLLAGVVHFYIYLNDVSDSTQAMLAPFVAAGFVTVTDWPGQVQQRSVYEHCQGVLQEEEKYKWVMVVDADEYMFTTEEGGCVGDFLTQGGFDKYGGVSVHWNYFSDDNRLFTKPREMLVEEAYRYAGPVRYVKTISQVAKTKLLDIHGSKYEGGGYAVDVRGRRVKFRAVTYDFLPKPQGLNLNHYVSMSLEDHLVKRFRGRTDTSLYFDLDLFMEFWQRVALDLSQYTTFERLPVPWVAPWVRFVLFGEEVDEEEGDEEEGGEEEGGEEEMGEEEGGEEEMGTTEVTVAADRKEETPGGGVAGNQGGQKNKNNGQKVKVNNDIKQVVSRGGGDEKKVGVKGAGKQEHKGEGEKKLIEDEGVENEQEGSENKEGGGDGKKVANGKNGGGIKEGGNKKAGNRGGGGAEKKVPKNEVKVMRGKNDGSGLKEGVSSKQGNKKNTRRGQRGREEHHRSRGE